jgi:hypothetical protein
MCKQRDRRQAPTGASTETLRRCLTGKPRDPRQHEWGRMAPGALGCQNGIGGAQIFRSTCSIATRCLSQLQPRSSSWERRRAIVPAVLAPAHVQPSRGVVGPTRNSPAAPQRPHPLLQASHDRVACSGCYGETETGTSVGATRWGTHIASFISHLSTTANTGSGSSFTHLRPRLTDSAATS